MILLKTTRFWSNQSGQRVATDNVAETLTIQAFPDGMPHQELGRHLLFGQIFCLQLHKIKEIIAVGGVPTPHPDLLINNVSTA